MAQKIIQGDINVTGDIKHNGTTISYEGIPSATAEGKVLVSDENLKFVEKDSVPMAENLVSEPISNDTMYSAGPTGGLADISTGEESYLREVKGYSIVWNQLLDASHSYTRISSHKYIKYSGNNTWNFIQNSSANESASSTSKLFDLTLMFGGNDNIPFSLTMVTEYPANGGITAQTCSSVQAFQRLFSDVDLVNAPYDAGTIKNVKTTKLVETGQNLWDASTMQSAGLKLLAGYKYEMYLSVNYVNFNILVSYDNGNTWTNTPISHYLNASGKYVFIFTAANNCIIKKYNTATIGYVGFVHSGNYCLTAGTNTSSNYGITTETIPPYEKREYNISGINGLNGIPDSSDNHCSVYDTKDVQRVGSIDLSEYQDQITLRYIEEDDEYAWFISKEDLPQNMDTSGFPSNLYLASKGSGLNELYNDDEEVIGILIFNDSTVDKPTDTILYPLLEPVATGADPFEPIRIEVNDMGMEYFEGLDKCPVNQLSQYYENLKDKLINITEPIEVSPASWNRTSQNLEALKIGNAIYKILQLGNSTASTDNTITIGKDSGVTASYNIAIGFQATANNQATGIAIGSYAYNSGGNGSVAIGSNSGTNGQTKVSTYGGVAIGGGAECAGGNFQYNVSIGTYTKNYLPYSVTFDGVSSTTRRTQHFHNAHYIFFRNEDASSSKNTFDKHTKGHYLDEYITNNTLTLQDGKYYVSYTDASNYKTFKINCVSGTATDITSTITGVHITIKVSGTTSHSVVGLDLLPYDATNDYGFDSCGRVLVDGTAEDIIATIDNTGCVVITAPADATIDEVFYNIR